MVTPQERTGRSIRPVILYEGKEHPLVTTEEVHSDKLNGRLVRKLLKPVRIPLVSLGEYFKSTQTVLIDINLQ